MLRAWFQAGILLIGTSAWSGIGALPAADRESPATRVAVEFNRDIRPILSDNCYQCHGPDPAQRKADLRLDLEAGARADLGGRRAIVAGDLAHSELYQRLISDQEDERMPPAKTGKHLSPRQIDLVRRWIEQGAKWQQHWSLLAPVAVAPPAVAAREWVRNPVDAFVLARLEREGLSPSIAADKATLIRRVSLDLTGLPPTPDEVDAFFSDNSPDAYEVVVDRLLASSRFGERMAVRWLDGARYADTNGYQSDGERFMWRWRDWVIDAYNRNMPFNQFTIEQVAGDMLASATLDQRIASGFNRNHRGNAEGGIIPEEYAVEYVVDRVETTFTVWQGLTVGCCRCHDHKFDPFSQREFYQLFAYFNNVPEFGRAVKYGNSPPMIKAPTVEQQRHLAVVDRHLTDAEAAYTRLLPELAAGQADWESKLDPQDWTGWTISRSQRAYFSLDESPREATSGQPAESPASGESEYKPGKIGSAARFDGSRFVNGGDVGKFGFYDKFSLAAWVLPEGERGGTVLSRMTDAEHGDGYYVVLADGRLQLNLVKRWLDDALRVETETRLAPGAWQHVVVTYDGSRLASGVQLYLDGKLQTLKVVLDLLNQTFETKEPLRIGGGNGPDGRFHGLIDDVRIFGDVLSEAEVQILATPEEIGSLRLIPADRRSPFQKVKLQAAFLERSAPMPMREARARLEDLRRERSRFIESLPTTMVMEEMPVARATHVLIRGDYDKPGDRVTAGLPGCLPKLSADAANNRLGLARWLVDRSNPLTARVAVNRLWQMLFGTGLVKTIDDFGAQGEWPSHLELLDWLAVRFMSPSDALKADSGNQAPNLGAWDVKALLRLIVTSATYRQASRATAAVMQRDPENRLLGRGPRVRLSAEMVRDQALFSAGLLQERLGGPSVKPYQPAGLWKELADTDYVQDSGESLYRRSLYTFFKRTVAPPVMATFDAAGRETCVVRETRTNTPLQALTLMNDVTFVEAARGLAQRVMATAGPSPADRIALAFRLVTSRKPKPRELDILVTGWTAHRIRFAKTLDAADKLTNIGELARPAGVDVVDLAAYTTVAALILNLDEAITKE